MASTANERTTASPVPVSGITPPAISALKTESQVRAQLKIDCARTSLTEVASAHDISPQQLSDIIHGRANLSKLALKKLGWKLWQFYEKVK